MITRREPLLLSNETHFPARFEAAEPPFKKPPQTEHLAHIPAQPRGQRESRRPGAPPGLRFVGVPFLPPPPPAGVTLSRGPAGPLRWAGAGRYPGTPQRSELPFEPSPWQRGHRTPGAAGKHRLRPGRSAHLTSAHLTSRQVPGPRRAATAPPLRRTRTAAGKELPRRRAAVPVVRLRCLSGRSFPAPPSAQRRPGAAGPHLPEEGPGLGRVGPRDPAAGSRSLPRRCGAAGVRGAPGRRRRRRPAAAQAGSLPPGPRPCGRAGGRRPGQALEVAISLRAEHLGGGIASGTAGSRGWSAGGELGGRI